MLWNSKSRHADSWRMTRDWQPQLMCPSNWVWPPTGFWHGPLRTRVSWLNPSDVDFVKSQSRVDEKIPSHLHAPLSLARARIKKHCGHLHPICAAFRSSIPELHRGAGPDTVLHFWAPSKGLDLDSVAPSYRPLKKSRFIYQESCHLASVFAWEITSINNSYQAVLFLKGSQPLFQLQA